MIQYNEYGGELLGENHEHIRILQKRIITRRGEELVHQQDYSDILPSATAEKTINSYIRSDRAKIGFGILGGTAGTALEMGFGGLAVVNSVNFDWPIFNIHTQFSASPNIAITMGYVAAIGAAACLIGTLHMYDELKSHKQKRDIVRGLLPKPALPTRA